MGRGEKDMYGDAMAFEIAVKLEAGDRERDLQQRAAFGWFDRPFRSRVKPLAAVVEFKRPAVAPVADDVRRAA